MLAGWLLGTNRANRMRRGAPSRMAAAARNVLVISAAGVFSSGGLVLLAQLSERLHKAAFNGLIRSANSGALNWNITVLCRR